MEKMDKGEEERKLFTEKNKKDVDTIFEPVYNLQMLSLMSDNEKLFSKKVLTFFEKRVIYLIAVRH